jgi:hypothetical protein
MLQPLQGDGTGTDPRREAVVARTEWFTGGDRRRIHDTDCDPARRGHGEGAEEECGTEPRTAGHSPQDRAGHPEHRIGKIGLGSGQAGSVGDSPITTTS